MRAAAPSLRLTTSLRQQPRARRRPRCERSAWRSSPRRASRRRRRGSSPRRRASFSTISAATRRARKRRSPLWSATCLRSGTTWSSPGCAGEMRPRGSRDSMTVAPPRRSLIWCPSPTSPRTMTAARASISPRRTGRTRASARWCGAARRSTSSTASGARLWRRRRAVRGTRRVCVTGAARARRAFV